MFQHTATRRRLLIQVKTCLARGEFQHTATRRRLLLIWFVKSTSKSVSTHSHPKAAAMFSLSISPPIIGFNTQPPEGGCSQSSVISPSIIRVSTHSHPKAAAKANIRRWLPQTFQHTATRRRLHLLNRYGYHWVCVSTHSHPKAAARSL